jgi:hypothetical protein
MTTALDKRLRQLEKKAPELPCPIPGHNKTFIFIEGIDPERDASNEKLRASIDACPRCKDKQKIIFLHCQRTDKPEPPKQEPPFGIHITQIGDGD